MTDIYRRAADLIQDVTAHAHPTDPARQLAQALAALLTTLADESLPPDVLAPRVRQFGADVAGALIANNRALREQNERLAAVRADWNPLALAWHVMRRHVAHAPAGTAQRALVDAGIDLIRHIERPESAVSPHLRALLQRLAAAVVAVDSGAPAGIWADWEQPEAIRR